MVLLLSRLNQVRHTIYIHYFEYLGFLFSIVDWQQYVIRLNRSMLISVYCVGLFHSLLTVI